MINLLDRFHIVPIAHDLDLSSLANNDCDSINMKNYKRATFIFSFDTLATASVTMYIYSGISDGACTSALTFRYAFGGAAIAAASCDVLAATSTSAALTITHGTYSDYMLIAEVAASEMDMINNEEWLTVRFVDPTGATGTLDGFAILDPRYPAESSATALT
jgi:hypothetical protein